MSKQILVVANKSNGLATKGRITTKDEHSFNCYMKDVSKYPVLPKEEQRELLQKYLSGGDERAKDKLINSNLLFVVSIAKMYLNQGLPLEDLIMEGNIGLIKAVEKYDLSQDIKFISYAVWWIRQSINQALIEKSSGIKLPVNKRDSMKRITKIEKDLEQKLGRKPTHDEIISHKESSNVKSTKKALKVKDIRNITNSKVSELSFDTNPNADDPEFTLLDITAADPIELKTPVERFEAELTDLMKVLTLQEQNIIKLSFGVMVKEKSSLEEIAVIYDVTKERIRQIRETAIRKLRNNPKISVLFDFMHEM